MLADMEAMVGAKVQKEITNHNDVKLEEEDKENEDLKDEPELA
jgi:hypothetical protein